MKWIIFSVLIVGIVFFLVRRSSSGPVKGERASTRSRKGVSARPGSSQATQRVSKPYAATEIKAGAKACEAALALAGKRFLVADTPSLPLEECDQAECKCRYLHHDDRRDDDNDRRLPNNLLSTQLYEQDGKDRRVKRRGRRKTD